MTPPKRFDVMNDKSPTPWWHRYIFVTLLAIIFAVYSVVSAPEDTSFLSLGVKAAIPGVVIFGFVWLMNRITSPAEPPTKEMD